MRPASVARKRFGQHFLVDAGVIADIVRVIDPREGDALVEIGPGRAALTDALLARVSHLRAIEIDRDLVRWLRSRHPPPRLDLMEADVLAVDFAALARDGPLRLVGNLPYNISSPLLIRLIDARASLIDAHFMLQKEVVDRIVAEPGQTAFGRLTVMLQTYFEVEALLDVPPSAFDPPPRVESAVLRMVPRTGNDPPEPAALEAVTAVAFGQRRKMLRGTLIPWLTARGVDAGALIPTDRPEDVTVAIWGALARSFSWRSARPG